MSGQRAGEQRFRKWIFGGLALPALLAVCAAGLAQDQPEAAPAPAAAPQPAPVYDLAGVRQLAISHQPALTAEQESLRTAEARQKAVDRLLVPTLLQRDLPVRRQQSALGVQVAAAGANHAEWEGIYATTRNYFSVLYARQQQKVADDALLNLETLREAIKRLVALDRKNVTQLHADKVDVYIQIVQGRREEAVFGIDRANAALREAVGLSADMPLVIADTQMPEITADATKEQLLEWALARRGEMVQVSLAADVVCLEVKAQSLSFLPTMRTFASASDVHSQQVPQGVRNGEYRPGALLMEMPPNLAGGRHGRVEQAEALHARAIAVVEKTRNLITLEVEDNYLKLLEARRQVAQFAKAVKSAKVLMDKTKTDFDMSAQTTPDDALNTGILYTQARLHANEAQYHYLLALAALERITAGGFNPGFDQGAAKKP
jgi:outer membrane protein TolC